MNTKAPKTEKRTVFLMGTPYDESGVPSNYFNLVDPDKPCEKYWRISENVEVDFPLMSDDEIRMGKLHAIDVAIQEAPVVVQNLFDKKRELLALSPPRGP